MKLIKMICNGLFILLGGIVFIILFIPMMIKDRKTIFKDKYGHVSPLGYDDEG